MTDGADVSAADSGAERASKAAGLGMASPVPRHAASPGGAARCGTARCGLVAVGAGAGAESEREEQPGSAVSVAKESESAAASLRQPDARRSHGGVGSAFAAHPGPGAGSARSPPGCAPGGACSPMPAPGGPHPCGLALAGAAQQSRSGASTVLPGDPVCRPRAWGAPHPGLPPCSPSTGGQTPSGQTPTGAAGAAGAGRRGGCTQPRFLHPALASARLCTPGTRGAGSTGGSAGSQGRREGTQVCHPPCQGQSRAPPPLRQRRQETRPCCGDRRPTGTFPVPLPPASAPALPAPHGAGGPGGCGVGLARCWGGTEGGLAARTLPPVPSKLHDPGCTVQWQGASEQTPSCQPGLV